MNQLISVPFHQDNLVLINHHQEPFVAMKAIVSNMGLDWAAQFSKIKDKFSSTIAIIATVGEDGKLREMTCLPLKKLPAWLYSVNPNKVAPDLKSKIIRYQEECDDVLWQYWSLQDGKTKGSVGTQSASKDIAYGNYRLKLMNALEREKNAEKREAIYQQLNQASQSLGLPTPDKNKIGFARLASDPVSMKRILCETFSEQG